MPGDPLKMDPQCIFYYTASIARRGFDSKRVKITISLLNYNQMIDFFKNYVKIEGTRFTSTGIFTGDWQQTERFAIKGKNDALENDVCCTDLAQQPVVDFPYGTELDAPEKAAGSGFSGGVGLPAGLVAGTSSGSVQQYSIQHDILGKCANNGQFLAVVLLAGFCGCLHRP